MPKPTYDTTVARIAGNILGHLLLDVNDRMNRVDPRAVVVAVAAARAIVDEVRRTTPPPEVP